MFTQQNPETPSNWKLKMEAFQEIYFCGHNLNQVWYWKVSNMFVEMVFFLYRSWPVSIGFNHPKRTRKIAKIFGRMQLNPKVYVWKVQLHPSHISQCSCIGFRGVCWRNLVLLIGEIAPPKVVHFSAPRDPHGTLYAAAQRDWRNSPNFILCQINKDIECGTEKLEHIVTPQNSGIWYVCMFFRFHLQNLQTSSFPKYI